MTGNTKGRLELHSTGQKIHGRTSAEMSLLVGVFSDQPEQLPLLVDNGEHTHGGDGIVVFQWLGNSASLKQTLTDTSDQKCKRMLAKWDVFLMHVPHSQIDFHGLILQFVQKAPGKVVLYGPKPSPEQLIHWLSIGVCGYLLATKASKKTEQALENYIDKQIAPLSSELVTVLVQGLQASYQSAHPAKKLSPIQESICQLLARGDSYIQIGDQLNIKLDNVRYHIKQIYQKYQVNKGTQLVKLLSGMAGS